MFKVHVVSRETITPSSPTPHPNRTFHLSLLDQIMPPLYVLFILFYSGNGHGNTARSDVFSQLKKSLSETLTLFYPFAGRIREDDLAVDCNDEGIDFLEAEINGQLSEFLRHPDVDALHQFLPSGYDFDRPTKDMLLAIQVTIFECGGMVIGLWYSHRIADGTTLATFIDRWASTTRGANEIAAPTFDSATLFPQREAVELSLSSMFPREEANVLTKRFLFKRHNLAKLRARGAPEDLRPTRVEALSALIWRSIMRAQRKPGRVRASVAMLPVSLRPRMVPPLPDHSFGNLCVDAVSTCISDGECNEDLQLCLEGLLRYSIRKIDSEYIKELQGEEGLLKSFESLIEVFEKYSECGMDICLFTSHCRFPYYEVDFGWGRPIWISSANSPFKNLIILMGTRSGDGIEAWVSLDEKDMARFEQDEELLSFTSPPHISLLRS